MQRIETSPRREEPSWRTEVRGFLAVAYNDFSVATRYKLKFVTELSAQALGVAPIAITAWVFSNGRFSPRLFELTGLSDQTTFVLLGFIGFAAIGMGNPVLLTSDAGSAIEYEMMTGTLERNFLAPVRRSVVMLGKAARYMVLCTYHSVSLFLFALLVFGIRPHVTGVSWLWALLALAALLVMNVGLGIVGASLMLGLRNRSVHLTLFHRPMMMLSGAYFLIELVPQPFRAISMANPMAYGIDALRGAITGRPLLLSSVEMSVLVAVCAAVGVSVLAYLAFNRMMKRQAQTGGLGLF